MTPEELQTADWILRFIDAGASFALLAVGLSLFYTGRIVPKSVMETIIAGVVDKLTSKFDTATAEVQKASEQMSAVVTKLEAIERKRKEGW